MASEQHVERKLAAILAADVVGFSRLTGVDEERTLARLRALRSDLIDPTIAVHRGRVVKRTGDGALIEFNSVVDAVRCAIEVQKGMVERNAGLPPERRIEFRIGVHLGDVMVEGDGDLMGDGVNIAARLEGICEPGTICLSEQAYWQVKARLDLAVSDLGEKQLKNIAGAVRVYALTVGIPAQAKPATEAKAAPPKARSPLAAFAAGITVLLILVAGGAWYFFGANRPATVASNAAAPAATARLSIVVLPFANLGGDPAQDYLVDALTDELTTAIARIRDSFVIARNTAFTYKGKPADAKAIGRDLGVRYVLEGSVQPGSAEMRVNAQLIDADSGAHVWADQFDTARADLLRMQDEIVTRLARAIDIQLTEAEAARFKRMPTANPDAEDLALQCQAAARKGGYIVKETHGGYAFCEQALAIDPQNVRALVLLSIKLRADVLSGGDPEGIKRADELVSKAIALDPNYVDAHVAKAEILRFQGRPEEAVVECERALALDPGSTEAIGMLASTYLFLGQFEKSLEYIDKAIRLSPNDPDMSGWFGTKAGDYFGLKQYDQTIESARRSIAINPNSVPYAHRLVIEALALTGRQADAHEALQRYLALPATVPKTIAAVRANYEALFSNPNTDPRVLDLLGRILEGLRKAGMPEE